MALGGGRPTVKTRPGSVENHIGLTYLLSKIPTALFAKTMNHGSIFGSIDATDYFPGTSPGNAVEYIIAPPAVAVAGWVAAEETSAVLWLGRG